MSAFEQIGPYRVVDLLGEGGMGMVYEAIHTLIERRVAIKILHAEYARNTETTTRFLNEARAVNRIEHPGVVQISDFGWLPDGVAYIVMEYLRGETLASRLKNVGGALGAQPAVSLCCQIADALAATHAQGIVHRDLKPANIMLVPDPQMPTGERTKILDFGIAKLTETLLPSQVKTRTSTVMGTPAYMSPEQCAGAGAVDDRSDVYSLGAMLFHMLAGRPPFDTEGAGVVMAMHLYEAPPQLRTLLPGIPAALSDLVSLLLSKNRSARPSMRELHARLLALSREFPLPSTPYRPALAAVGMRTETAAGSTLGATLAEVQKRRAAQRRLILLSLIGLVGTAGAGWLAAGQLRRASSVETSWLQPTAASSQPAVAQPAVTRTAPARSQTPASVPNPDSAPSSAGKSDPEPQRANSGGPELPRAMRTGQAHAPKRKESKTGGKAGPAPKAKEEPGIDFSIPD